MTTLFDDRPIPTILRIAPGVAWEDNPDNWNCPHDDCSACEDDRIPVCGVCGFEFDLDAAMSCDKCKIRYEEIPDRWLIDYRAVFTNSDDKACMKRKDDTASGLSPVGWCYLPYTHEGDHYFLNERDVKTEEDQSE